MVKNLPAMQKMQVQSLGWEESLEKEMAPTPVFLPEELCGQRSLAGYSPWGHKESDVTEQLSIAQHMQSTSCETSGWMKHKLESRLQGEISITSVTQMTKPFQQKVKN